MIVRGKASPFPSENTPYWFNYTGEWIDQMTAWWMQVIEVSTFSINECKHVLATGACNHFHIDRNGPQVLPMQQHLWPNLQEFQLREAQDSFESLSIWSQAVQETDVHS